MSDYNNPNYQRIPEKVIIYDHFKSLNEEVKILDKQEPINEDSGHGIKLDKETKSKTGRYLITKIRSSGNGRDEKIFVGRRMDIPDGWRVIEKKKKAEVIEENGKLVIKIDHENGQSGGRQEFSSEKEIADWIKNLAIPGDTITIEKTGKVFKKAHKKYQKLPLGSNWEEATKTINENVDEDNKLSWTWWRSLSINEMKELQKKYFPVFDLDWLDQSTILAMRHKIKSNVVDIWEKEKDNY